MLNKEERVGLIVYLYYNRDAKKLKSVGDILYHSKKMRYIHLYIEYKNLESITKQLSAERYIKKVEPSHWKDINQDFVGNLYREETEIEKN